MTETSCLKRFTLTPREALRIQAYQLDGYCTGKPYGEAIRAEIAKGTNIEGLDLKQELPLDIINQRIPRGGSIEDLVNAAKAARQQRDRDSLRLEKARSGSIERSLDDLKSWAEITELAFKSEDPESRYYGTAWVCTSMGVKRLESHTTSIGEPWEDFGEVLRKA